MFGVADDNWRYSHADIDAGTKVYHTRKSQVLDLILKRARVTRAIKLLWRRHTFANRTHREPWGTRFQFTIEYNQVEGVYYKHLRGYVLWRDWFERIETSTGGIHLSRTNREIAAVVFNGKPVFRVSTATITDRLREQFPEAFNDDLVAIDDLIS